MSGHAVHNYDDPAAPPRLCQNCGAALRGPYCAQCGQHDIDYHRSFYHLTHDLLENLFHFEGKFFASVAWLMAKPGKLTAEFNAGRRMSQVNPLRFYIFVTVLFFLGVHLLNHGHLFDFDRSKGDELSSKVQDIAKATQSAGKLTEQQAQAFGERLGEAMKAGNGQVDRETVTKIVEGVQRDFPSPPETAAAPRKRDESKATADTGDRFGVGRALEHKLKSGELSFTKILDEIESRVPTLLFLGMPVFALLLKLLYLGTGRYYIEHLIFSIHLHTWAFLAFMIGNGYFKLAALGPRWITTLLGWVFTIWMIWYVFAAFRTVYRQRWLRTTVKIAVAGMGYLFALFLLTGLIVVATLAWLVMK